MISYTIDVLFDKSKAFAYFISRLPCVVHWVEDQDTCHLFIGGTVLYSLQFIVGSRAASSFPFWINRILLGMYKTLSFFVYGTDLCCAMQANSSHTTTKQHPLLCSNHQPLKINGSIQSLFLVLTNRETMTETQIDAEQKESGNPNANVQRFVF